MTNPNGQFSYIKLNPHERILVRTLLYDGIFRKLSLIETDGNRLKISDFDRETANTVFIDGVATITTRHLTDTEWGMLRTASPHMYHNILADSEASENDLSDIRNIYIVRLL